MREERGSAGLPPYEDLLARRPLGHAEFPRNDPRVVRHDEMDRARLTAEGDGFDARPEAPGGSSVSFAGGHDANVGRRDCKFRTDRTLRGWLAPSARQTEPTVHRQPPLAAFVHRGRAAKDRGAADEPRDEAALR